MHTHARIHNAKTTTIYNICNCISDICKPISFPKVTPKRLSFQGDVLMLNVGHWRAWHLNSVIASHEAWGVEVQEVRKNEVSVKGERGYERIIYICNSHSANFLKVCLERFFLHDALMSFLTSVCCRFLGLDSHYHTVISNIPDVQDVWKSCCKVMRQRGGNIMGIETAGWRKCVFKKLLRLGIFSSEIFEGMFWVVSIYDSFLSIYAIYVSPLQISKHANSGGLIWWLLRSWLKDSDFYKRTKPPFV